MGDEERVCCMCGDVGFPDKLFQCSRCSFRLQHSYCSNYYYGNDSSSSSTTTSCDWCLSEGRTTTTTNSNTRPIIKIKSPSSSIDHNHNHNHNNNYDNQRVKHHSTTNNNNNESSSSHGERGSSNNVARNSGIPSPRTGTHRRYKLLKDVMC